MFIIDLVHQQVANHNDEQPTREEAFFAGAGLDDQDLQAAGQEARDRRKAQRLRQAKATNSNLGFGHDLRPVSWTPPPASCTRSK